MMPILQLLLFLIAFSLGASLEMAGETRLAELGQEALHAVWSGAVVLFFAVVWILCGLAAG